MTVRRCPFCGNEEDDGKIYRLAIYKGDKRMAVIPAGTATFSEVKAIVKQTPDSYLVEEVLDKDGRITYTRRVAESLMVYADGVLTERARS